MTKLRLRPASLVAGLLSTGLLLLSGCGSLLESNEPPMQSYILRTALADTVAGAPASGAVLPVLQVFRPQAAAGLDSDRIAVVRADRRFDGYAASRWSDSVPKLLESLVVESLSQSGRFRAVLADAGGFDTNPRGHPLAPVALGDQAPPKGTHADPVHHTAAAPRGPTGSGGRRHTRVRHPHGGQGRGINAAATIDPRARPPRLPCAIAPTPARPWTSVAG